MREVDTANISKRVGISSSSNNTKECSRHISHWETNAEGRTVVQRFTQVAPEGHVDELIWLEWVQSDKERNTLGFLETFDELFLGLSLHSQ